MKILVWTMAKPKEAAPIFAYGIAYGLVKNGHEVYALIQESVPNRSEWDKLLDEKHIYYTKSNNNVESKLKQLVSFVFSESREIKSFYGKVKFDYVISTVFANWSVVVSPFLKGNKKVAVCHDPIPHSGEKKINAMLARLFYKRHDKLIVLSEKFKKDATIKYNKKIEDIVSMKHGRFSSYLDYDEEYKYHPKFINFLFFGRIQKYKGLNVLGEAYKKLSKEYDNVSLTIAGSGDFSEYKNLYNELPRVNMENRYINDNEVGGLFNGPNVVAVVPYIDATQSGIIPIAFEFGVPIIASDTGGLKEQLDDGKIGLLFETGNSDALYEAMKYMVDHETEFQVQKEKEKEYLSSLNWDVVTKRLIEEL